MRAGRPSKSISKSLLKRRIALQGKSYKQAWEPIIAGFVDTLDKQVHGDASYLEVSRVVDEYTKVPTIRKTLMGMVNRTYEIGY